MSLRVFRFPVSAVDGTAIDVGAAWVLTSGDSTIVDATSSAARVLNVPFHRLLQSRLLSFFVEGADTWTTQLAAMEPQRRVGRRTGVKPAENPPILVAITLEIVEFEDRRRAGWHFVAELPAAGQVPIAVGGDLCPACGAIRIVYCRLPHGTNCECERCGYVWHCDEPRFMHRSPLGGR
jgi:hypothetical protein